MAKIKITQVKSGIDRPERQKQTLRALGLKKMHATKEAGSYSADTGYGPYGGAPGESRGSKVIILFAGLSGPLARGDSPLSKNQQQ
ncbi:uL30 family ribosomal protein [Puia sp. P3]|uniref:uL30 family ribosomal protein n=1 Tax=Puia sp. P3 TaxID=3423952 RepID=UPI003D664465